MNQNLPDNATAPRSVDQQQACSAWRKRCQAAEAKVLEQVRLCGGFSVFWATENMDRARAIERLHRKKGMIEPKKGKAYGRFPWCGYRIVKPNKEAHQPSQSEV